MPSSHESTSRIELVVFDLGRVLVRICDDWAQACACAGVSFPEQISPGDLLKMRDLAHRAEAGAIGWEQLLRASAPLIHLPPRQLASASEAYIRGAYPGAAALVDELNAAGIATACLSNTHEQHWQVMSDPLHPSSFPLHRLSYRFASHLVGARKPDDAIYARVEQVTGVTGRGILFFDDVEENVEGARHRGWNARRIDPKPDDPLPQLRRALREFRVLA